MTLPRAVVLLSAAVFLAAGVPFLIAPAEMTAFVGVSLTGITADNDVRAVYGGVATGLGVFMLLAARRPAWLVPSLWVVLLTLSGLVTGRLISWVAAGWPEPIALALHAAEVAGVMLAVVALRMAAGERARPSP